MEYSPRSEQELRSATCLDPGVYDFEVVKAIEKVSKAGNDMIALTLRVFPGDDSAPRLINDWLVAGSDFGELKINRFAHAIGQEDSYFDGSFSSLTCECGAGKCRLTIQASEDYGDQNRVKDYLPATTIIADVHELEPPTPDPLPKKSKSKASSLAGTSANDDIPF